MTLNELGKAAPIRNMALRKMGQSVRNPLDQRFRRWFDSSGLHEGKKTMSKTRTQIDSESVESLAIALFAVDRGMKRKQDFHEALSRYVHSQRKTQLKYWKMALAALRRLQDEHLQLGPVER